MVQSPRTEPRRARDASAMRSQKDTPPCETRQHHHLHHHRSNSHESDRSSILKTCPLLQMRVYATTTALFISHCTAFQSFVSRTSARHAPAYISSKSTSSFSMASDDKDDKYTLADQVARFARANKDNNERYLNIESVYDPSYLKGLRVAVTGANRGIGLALATELTSAGANVVALVRSSSEELEKLKPAEIIKDIDVQDDKKTAKLSELISGGPIDIVRFHSTIEFET